MRKQLYGILISANEKETSDIWDFEMLLLYKAMGNEEKFQSEAEMFCATYKGSSYIDKVNQLREKLYDVDKASIVILKRKQWMTISRSRMSV